MTTEQRLLLSAPAVAACDAGAAALGRAYWDEVERATCGLVRARETITGTELRLLPTGPTLLRFGPPAVTVRASVVAARYPILGGLLAREPAGFLTLAQVAGDGMEARSSVAGFVPRLGARPGAPRWTGAAYAAVQARLHDAIGRRFLARLAEEARR